MLDPPRSYHTYRVSQVFFLFLLSFIFFGSVLPLYSAIEDNEKCYIEIDFR